MKLEYTPSERMKVRETKECIICKNKIDDAEVDIGRIFCHKCSSKRRPYADKNNLCVSCFANGLVRENLKGYGACKDHLIRINDLVKQLDDLKIGMDADYNGKAS